MSTRILPEFDLLFPRTVDEALAYARSYGGEAEILAGGTDVLVKMKIGAIAPKTLICIRRIDKLRSLIYDDGKGLTVGALAKINDLDRSSIVRSVYPILCDATCDFANAQILNMGTVGGNVCNASPAGDLIPPLLALNAEVELVSAAQCRAIGISEFFLGPGKTVRRHDELVTGILIPKPASDSLGAFVRMTRTAEDLAKVSAAAAFSVRDGSFFDVRIAFGAVAPTVFRARAIEDFLEGQPVTDAAIKNASSMASESVRPISDLRSTAEYRRKVVGAVLKRAIEKALARGRVEWKRQ